MVAMIVSEMRKNVKHAQGIRAQSGPTGHRGRSVLKPAAQEEVNYV